MAQQTTELAEDQKIRREHKFFFDISAGLVFILILLIIGKLVFKEDAGYDSNVFLNVIAVLTTILVLDRRADWRAENELKERLVMQARSQSNEIAKGAVEELRHRKWLKSEGGLLTNAKLILANLQGADLVFVNLQNADLRGANLQKASLLSANLQNANLSGANLQSALLSQANLQAVDLEDAELQDADLEDTDLSAANLQGVNLEGARLDRNTTLPNSSKWTPDTDMARFTDPDHPQFWRSDDPHSPAYRGKGGE